MLRRISLLLALGLGCIALAWGLFSLQGIFIDERDDAIAAIAARRRALEQYAQQELGQRLRARLAEARPTIVEAARDPLIPASGLWLVENGQQLLPRTAQPAPGSDTPAVERYRALRGGQADALAEAERARDPGSPWAERLAMFGELKAALDAGDRAAIESRVRDILRHRASYVIASTHDLPLALAMLAELSDQAQPQKSLMQSLLRDGLSPAGSAQTVPGNEGLQRMLLRNMHRFTRADFEQLSEIIVELSRKAEVLHADFAARVTEPAHERLAVPLPIDEPTVAHDGRWYVEPPREGRVLGMAIEIEPLLSEIGASMRDRGLLGSRDRVVRSAQGPTVAVSRLSLGIDSPDWEPAIAAVHGRYRLKAALEVVIAALAFGVIALGIVIYRRRHRFVELKSDFVSAVSHELRTPLASIRLMAETLERRTKEVPRARDYATRIVRDIDALSFLVENILSFNRLSRGRWVPKLARVRLADAVEKLAQERDLWARRPAEVEAVGLDGIELEADPDLLQLLLTNLARNGCQYNEREPARIRIEAKRAGALELRVSDNGVGIASGERDKVFDDFYRSSAGKRSGERGSGLGLAICRKIMEAHGGTIRIAASSPEGTTFELSFPG